MRRRPALTTGFVLTRLRDGFGSWRAMRVLVNGEEVAPLDYGASAPFPCEPGVRVIRVAMDWCKSEPLRLEVRPGEVVELECGTRFRGSVWLAILATMVRPRHFFF